MKTGRPSKPTEQKRLEGNPGRRPLPEFEPELKAQTPRAPKWIRGDALSHRLWRDLVRQLEPMHVVTASDQTALALAVEAFRDWIDARREVRKSGLLIERTSDRGSVSTGANPAIAVRNDAWKRLAGQLGRFGMDPASRSGVESLGDAAEDEFDAFMRRDH